MGYNVDLECPHCKTLVFESAHTSNTKEMWTKVGGFCFGSWEYMPAAKMKWAIEYAIAHMVDAYPFVYQNKYYTEWGTSESTITWFIKIREACVTFPTCIVKVDC